jgi:DHA1 family tetracycline resistance protein-like MFS transporter
MSGANKRGILIALLVTVFVDLLGVGIVIPVLPILFADPSSGIFDGDVAIQTRYIVYGFMAAAFPLAQFFGAPILGALSDRYGRKPILAISLLGTMIGYLLFAYGVVTGNLWLMFFSRALDGFTGGNISIAFSSIADISDEKTKTKNFGLIGMAFGVGFVIGPYLGGKLADPTIVSWFDYATPFWFAGILSAINLILVFTVYRETLAEKTASTVSLLSGFMNIGKAFQSKGLRSIFIVSFLFTFGFSFFTQFFQIFLNEKFAFTAAEVGDVFAYIGLWIAFTQGFLTRVFSSRFSSVQMMRITTLGLAVIFMLLLVPDQRWQLFFVMPFIAIFQGLLSPNALNIVSAQASPEEQGEVMGINQSVASFAQCIPPVVAGYIVTIDYNLPIAVASGCTALAGVLFLIFFRGK